MRRCQFHVSAIAALLTVAGCASSAPTAPPTPPGSVDDQSPVAASHATNTASRLLVSTGASGETVTVLVQRYLGDCETANDPKARACQKAQVADARVVIEAGLEEW